MYMIIYKSMLSVNWGSFTSSILIWVFFISFSCLIVMARTYTIIFIRSGRRVMFWISGKKTFSFSPLNVMLAVSFHNILY